AELLDAGAPLGRALVVAHSLAREDLPTAHDPDRVQLLHLAGGGGGARLVQTPHTAGHVARAHARQSLEGETRELEAAVARGAAQRGGAHPEFAGGRWVVAAKKRELAVAQQQPAVLGGLLVAREHAAGAFEPPGGDGGITAKGEGIPREPE